MSARPRVLLVTALSVALSTMALSTMALSTIALGPATARTGPMAGAAGVTDTWGPVHRFERDPHGQSMVVGPGDVTTVAWGSPAGWPEPVKVAQRTADGRWSAAVSLGVGYDPVVATNAAGDLTVAWCRDRKGRTTGVWVARKPQGKAWTTPVHVSRDRAAPRYPDGGSTYGATGLDVAAGPGGAAVVTWAWGNWERDVPFRVQVVSRASRGHWTAVQTLTPSAGRAGDAQVVLARNGRAWVAYDRSPATGRARVEVRSGSVSGVWHPAERVGTGTLGELGVSGRGDVSVALLGHGRVALATRAAGGGWQDLVQVTPPDVRVRDWSAALSPRGAVLVAYLWRHDRVDVVRRAAGGHWTAPLTLAEPAERLTEVVTAVDARGDMFAGWDNSYGMWSRYRPAGQGWLPVTTAQPDRGVDVLEAVLAQVAPGGDVALLWAQEERSLRARWLDVQ